MLRPVLRLAAVCTVVLTCSLPVSIEEGALNHFWALDEALERLARA